MVALVAVGVLVLAYLATAFLVFRLSGSVCSGRGAGHLIGSRGRRRAHSEKGPAREAGHGDPHVRRITAVAATLLLLVGVAQASSPADSESEPVAIVYVLTGMATSGTPSQPRAVRLFDRLPAGMTLDVAAESSVALAFSSGFRYALGPKARVRLGKTDLDSQSGPVTRLRSVPPCRSSPPSPETPAHPDPPRYGSAGGARLSSIRAMESLHWPTRRSSAFRQRPAPRDTGRRSWTRPENRPFDERPPTPRYPFRLAFWCPVRAMPGRCEPWTPMG